MNCMQREQLKSALRQVLGGIGDRGTDAFLESLREIDRFAGEEMLPKKLAHYLSRRSYLKALEYLESEEGGNF